MNEYEEMRNRHQKRFDTWAEVHMFFAFDDKQFREGMQSLRLDPDKDTDKLYKTGGGFYKKTDAPELQKIISENYREFEDAIESLYLDPETVRNDPRLLHGLQKAERAIIGQE